MDEEIAKGENGRIIMKMNSVTDMDFIRKVTEAYQAGGEDRSDRAWDLLYPPGNQGKDRESACDKYRRKISGASKTFRLRKRSRCNSLYWIC